MTAKIGCLMIDEPMSGENRLSGLLFPPEIAPFPFDWRAGEGCLGALQSLLQAARKRCGAAAILARGAGCGAALALAEQLPVERLALVEPRLDVRPARGSILFPDPRLRRDVRRINAYARRNLSLCVADALVIEGENDRCAERLVRWGLGANGRVARLRNAGEAASKWCTICENGLKDAVIAFLRDGDLPNGLAQNPEMCIING